MYFSYSVKLPFVSRDGVLSDPVNRPAGVAISATLYEYKVKRIKCVTNGYNSGKRHRSIKRAPLKKKKEVKIKQLI